MRVQDPSSGQLIELPEIGFEPHSGAPSETNTAKSFARPNATALSIADKPDAVDPQAWREYLAGLAKWAGEFPAAREAFTRVKASGAETFRVGAMIQHQLTNAAKSSQLDNLNDRLKEYGIALHDTGDDFGGVPAYEVHGGDSGTGPRPWFTVRKEADPDAVTAQAAFSVGMVPSAMRPFVDSLSAEDRQKLTALLRDASISPNTFTVANEPRSQWQIYQKVARVDTQPDAVTIHCQDNSILRNPVAIELTRTADGALRCVTRNFRGQEQPVRI